ncbi:ATP-binding protein [Burkholderia cenocepacia]|jgi:hypothetical protein|uniref:ATP-binding protein n=1 Tax=Burkholderia cenocepacia TaxID=95486 RepID=UPI0004F7DA81|nr:ATP-binding protein [Burkholderia cenocepacia]AIO43059.1 AAA domain protein [Burkholderia cepacia]KGC05154.1 AAA domain protein [Burkholderia cepacia]MCW3528542.1 ATP-binding protein [Burkholderia cenocepacia]MCW3618592.1 ATP-binding protein [Burkholderia cenocepacia]MCW3656439.1 ATP-binding protein [Burkholderia cenocepacia]
MTDIDKTSLESTVLNDPLDHVIVWTPAIDRLANTVASWIRVDSPGGTVTGKPRTGKSDACVYLSAVLQTKVGYPVAVVIWSMPRNSSIREREYTQERMKQCGCSAILHRDIAVLRTRLFDHIAQMADVACANRVVVIVDEAQELADDHYGYLVHCFNELRRRQLRPFFLLVGQPELESGKYYWDKSEFHQIAGRFHVHRHQFKGIDKSEFAEVLVEFDKSIFSASTENLAMKLPDGWVLSDIAPALASAIDIVRNRLNLSEDVPLPMQYLRSTILAFIYRASSLEKGRRKISPDLMMNCLIDSGFMGVVAFYANSAERDHT